MYPYFLLIRFYSYRVSKKKAEQRIVSTLRVKFVYVNWASKETYHFFRVTFTETRCIKIIHIWTQIR